MEALTPHLNSIMPIYRFNRSEGMLKLDFCANRMFILPTPRRVLKDTTCSICLQEFKGGDMVRVFVGCEHEFHYCCIDMWLLGRSSCPLCRGQTPVYHVYGN